MFHRLRILLAAFERGEFCEVGLCARLDAYLRSSAALPQPSRKATVSGMPILWGEP